MAESLIVDANPLISSLLGGRAREILFSELYQFHSTQHTLFEVEKHIPKLASKLNVTELHLFREYQLLPIVACQPREYENNEAEAIRLIAERDPMDVPILALTLARKLPLWTNDGDFSGIPEIQIYSTEEMIQRMKSR